MYKQYTRNESSFYSVQCCYNVAQDNMLLHPPLQERGQNINESLNPQKTQHT